MDLQSSIRENPNPTQRLELKIAKHTTKKPSSHPARHHVSPPKHQPPSMRPHLLRTPKIKAHKALISRMKKAPSSSNHTEQKPSNIFENDKPRHETKEAHEKKAPTSNIADKGEQREGPSKVVVQTSELKLYTPSRRCATKRGAHEPRGDGSNGRRGNDVGWRTQSDGKAKKERKKKGLLGNMEVNKQCEE